VSRKEEFITSLQKRELKLLNATHDGRGAYCTRRNIVAELARQYIDSALVKTQPKILEIGCGSGNALLKIISNHPLLKPSNLTGTSLNELPEHDLIRQRGINLRIPVSAEFLSTTFTTKFDIILASAVFQWTDIPVAFGQINQIMASNGLLIGFDQRSVVACLNHHASRHLDPLLTCQEVSNWEYSAHGLTAFYYA